MGLKSRQAGLEATQVIYTILKKLPKTKKLIQGPCLIQGF